MALKRKPIKETLEEEINEAIEEEKEHVEEGKKIIEQQGDVNEISQETTAYEKKIPSVIQAYEEKDAPRKSAYTTEYIENQDFYIKNENDFDKIKITMQELKIQDPSMSRVDDSDLWEIEPETKKLKIRKMPRTVLDMLKQNRIIIDYYKGVLP